MLKLTIRSGCAVCVLMWLAMPTQAEPDPPENFRLEMGWQITVDGEPAGTEEATFVESATTKTVFLSGKKQPATENAPLLVTHVQRDPDGKLRKYRRHEKVRKGKGVHAFQKAGGIRIVGVNVKVAPVELSTAASAVVWDPEVWHPLVLWVRSNSPVAAGQLNVLDVSTRALRTVQLERAGQVSMTDGSGAAADVSRWKLQGLDEGGALEIFVSGGHLRGVKRGTRAMLEKGWAWEPPAVKPPVPADPAASPAEPPPPAEEKPPVDPGDGP